MSSEADTCRRYVLPKLYEAGWTDNQINEQRTFTDGRIDVRGAIVTRGKQKRADYLLRYRPDFMMAVVEAKADYKLPGDGLGQAKEYAQMLDLKFAYSTNGTGIVEHDFITGLERDLTAFPSSAELWSRLQPVLDVKEPEAVELLLYPSLALPDKPIRYYQEIAMNRVLQAILTGRHRVLLTMATGTGKTVVAFHICYKLWQKRWTRSGGHRRPRILYVSDRTVLVDDPKDKQFTPFGDARWRISGEAVLGREMYFSTYQAIAEDERRPGLFREFPRDFFDLVIVDECHRGSASDDSNWRQILEWFEPACQLGMTATPLRAENIDTYKYFGDPVYTYSLRQGINDGFLAPYRVHRIIPDVDALGWRPDKGQLDKHGRLIPDELYQTPDFERILSHRARTETIAKSIVEFLQSTDQFGKTIVFCVDQEHAEDMRQAINNHSAELVRKYPDYVVRITADEKEIGKGHLSRFQDVEEIQPVVVTTSKLLTTGVDIPTCKNIVLVSVINSMTEFKQIIGRGTRVRSEYGKLWFNILDYTGCASRLFADPEFDGDPIDPPTEGGDGEPITEPSEPPEPPEPPVIIDPQEPVLRKLYVDGGPVEICAHIVFDLDADGRRLSVVKYTEYAGEKIRSMFTSAAVLRTHWSKAEERDHVLAALADKGVTLEQLADNTNQPEADPFDLLCMVAFNTPVRSRRERAERLAKNKVDFWEFFQPEAREILREILDKYIEGSVAQFKLPDVLKLQPISRHGNTQEIASLFGGPALLKEAVDKMQSILYAN